MSFLFLLFDVFVCFKIISFLFISFFFSFRKLLHLYLLLFQNYLFDLG